jgi:DNA polymerase III subunit delta
VAHFGGVNSPGAYVYILHGEDTFSRDEALQGLKERMRGLPAGEHNLTDLSAAQATLDELRAAADVVPFLAERRMVIVRGLLARLQGRGAASGRRGRQRSKNTAPEYDEYQALLDYLPDLPATTSVVFVEDGAVDTDPIKAAVPANRAFVRYFPRVDDVAGWVRKRARALNVDVDETAVRELAFLGGDDLRRLDNEIRKLSAAVPDRSVTRADVRELVVGREQSVWSLLDALTERRPDRALRALRVLYTQGEAPEALVARDMGPLYRRLLVAKEISLADRHARAAVDVAGLGLNPRSLPRLTEQAERFERDELEHALELLLETDRQMKTGEAQPEPAVELLVTTLAGRLRP